MENRKVLPLGRMLERWDNIAFGMNELWRERAWNKYVLQECVKVIMMTKY